MDSIDITLWVISLTISFLIASKIMKVRRRAVDLLWLCQQLPASEQTITIQLAMEHLRREIGGVPWDNEQSINYGQELRGVENDLID